jgi:hypothetical protein
MLVEIMGIKSKAKINQKVSSGIRIKHLELILIDLLWLKGMYII